MAASERADEIRSAFLGALQAEGLHPQPLSDLAASASRSVRELFAALGNAGREVYLVPGVALVNVHVRSEPPGWWNILKSVKRDLDSMAKEFGLNCTYVLLIGRKDLHVADGYIVGDFSKPPFTRMPRAEDTKYSINERQHLDERAKLLSVAKVAKVLARQRIANVDAP